MAMSAFPSPLLLSLPRHFLPYSPSLAFNRLGKISKPQRPFLDQSVCCCSESEYGKDANARPLNGKEAAFKVAMPMIAAAIIGCTGNFVHAEDWKSISMPISNVELVKGQDSYETLLKKIQESRQRSLKVGEDQSIGEREDFSISSSLTVQKLKDATENAQGYGAARNFGQMDNVRASASSPLDSKKPLTTNPQAQAFEATTATKSQKKTSHGFLPLFVSQFLLLVAMVGGGVALFVLPDSSWNELQKKLDDNLEKASPLVEEAYTKMQPLIMKAVDKTQEVATQAKPYVRQAVKAAKPMAQQAFEASKPILREAQSKASELLQQAQDKAKSINQQ